MRYRGAMHCGSTSGKLSSDATRSIEKWYTLSVNP